MLTAKVDGSWQFLSLPTYMHEELYIKLQLVPFAFVSKKINMKNTNEHNKCQSNLCINFEDM